jgi:predicted Zn-dependent peptidase
MTLLAEAPVAGAPRPWTVPSFDRISVAGGRVLAAHLPGRALAVVQLVADAGAVAEPAGREGVAELVVQALSEGAGDYDSYGFAVAGERLGASWLASADWDSLRCGFQVPVSELSAATDLLADAVRRPRLESATLARLRDERLDEIRIERSQPVPRAMAAFNEAVFSDASRYARSDGGDLETVAAITDDDVAAFHAARLGPETATLVVVGDLADVDIEDLGRRVFDGWSAGTAAMQAPEVAERASGRRVLVVDRPGAVQSILVSGHTGPPRDIPDYVAMTTMAMVLGGMFTSRLNMKLREEKGYAYGAFGGFDSRRDGGVFVARSSVQSEVTVPALTDLVAEIERTHAEGVEPEELEQARAYRAGVFPINFASAGSVASGLGDLVTHNLPDDHFDQLRAKVLEVTKPELDTAATTRLRPDDLVTVVVGDASLFADDLRAAGLGPVEIVPDGD